ncbi:excreted virulence factor EspC (type VII ESX diderm) [Actinomadura pelletieri DSM 43383]|uniref:Excreted virulence factor EspC (Type VII ESX diderm) n=1 Tax=Actinomadura pelletieri DSM 43383 TaxID=1120940 RepID=A0A495QPP5_9ACTN|nr:type VII secretion target [Actinomadura pelletieri]RKS74950.1 excreted virulence factor EspC (type VII ESX diderm) [Actinomadura pelletieri DSM 43383]
MSFRVEPAALESFAQAMDALAGDCEKAKSYVQSHQEVVADGRGIIFGLLYAVGVLRLGEQVQKNIERLDGLSSGSARELRKCAEVYRNTEKKVAERIDQTYPMK